MRLLIVMNYCHLYESLHALHASCLVYSVQEPAVMEYAVGAFTLKPPMMNVATLEGLDLQCALEE